MFGKKRLQRGLAMIFTGEVIALFKSDPIFTSKRRMAKGFDKAKVLATSLYELNKSLIQDASQRDVQKTREKTQNYVTKEYTKLEDNVTEFVNSAQDKTQETVQPWIDATQAKIQELTDKLQYMSEKERAKREKKIKQLQDKISSITS